MTKMAQHEPPAMPRLRADAQRNRERLLAAAATVFGAGGGASLEAVAREAGVGIGTLYRHFPTREALFEAVYRREVDQLAELAGRLAGEPDPAQALRRWLRASVEFVATKKGMSQALAIALVGTSELTSYSSARLTEALGGLLRRAAEAGEVRSDIGPEELFRALVGMCMMHAQADWKPGVFRMIDVLVDGLAAQAKPPAG